MRKILSLFTALLFVGTMFAADEIYKQTIFSTANNSGNINNYTSTWTNTTDGFTVTLQYANNNNNGWNSGQIKIGNKTTATVGTIITNAAIDKAITKVELGIVAITTSKVNSIKLYSSTDGTNWTEEGSFAKASGTKAVEIESEHQAANLYYKIAVDCNNGGNSNGFIQISQVDYYVASSDPAVSADPVSFDLDADAHATQSVDLTYENWSETVEDAEVTIHSASPCTSENKITDPTWISNIQIDETDYESFTFDVAANTSISESRTLYLQFYAMGTSADESTVEIPVTQAKASITTMDGIFAASETQGTYSVVFNKWWISAVSGYNAYVTDGEKGFSIYKSGHGFAEGDTLSGTASFNLTRYNGAAQTYALTASTEGLTVTSGTAANAQETTIDALAAVNTGALVTLKKVTYNEEAGTFVKGDKAIAITSISGFTPSLENGTKYDVTGVFVYNTDATATDGKRILLRKSGDVVVTPCETSVTITPGETTNGTFELSATSVCGDDDGGVVFVQNITPSAGYEFDEITSTSGTVDNVNKKVTAIKAATTITVKFKELPKYTVSFATGKSNPTVTAITETVGGQGITLPAGVTPVKTGWSFAGWSEIVILTETTETPTLLEADSKYYPANNITLYSVYERTEGGGTTPSAYEVGDEGDFVLAALVEGEEKTWYALPENPTLNSGKITGAEITVLNTKGVNYVASDDATGYTWTIAKSGDFYTLCDGTNYLFHKTGGNSGTDLNTATTAEYLWDISSDANGLIFAGVNDNTVKSRGMLFNGSAFGGYALSNKDASGYYRVKVLPIAAASTTYYHSSPSEISTAVDNVDASSKAVKVLKNGLLLIEKNGRIYNTQGQLVK